MLNLAEIFANFLSFLPVVYADDWSYSHLDRWPPSCSTGVRQSPIAIEKDEFFYRTVPPLEFHNYNEKFNLAVVNNGHSVEIKFKINSPNDTSTLPFITGRWLREEYTLDNIHFHWDSEHTIDGYRYPLEAHFVHYKTSDGSVAKSLEDKQNGPVVLSVMYDISKEPSATSHIFRDILEISGEISVKVSRAITIQDEISIGSLLPQNTGAFVMYEGSLTTPNCNEGVTWFIFLEPSQINKNELDVFREMHTGNDSILELNYRPLQPKNRRTVYRSKAKAYSTSSHLLLPIFICCFVTYYYWTFSIV